MKYKVQMVCAVLFLTHGFIAGCSRNVHGGDPALPLSSTNGTLRTFPFTRDKIALAMTNAFVTEGYRGMLFGSNLEMRSHVPDWCPTNGFVLFALMGPITNIPLNGIPKTVVPYTPCFYITLKAQGVLETKVTIFTVSAIVIDGKEPGVHGGWANHTRNVPPVKAEEENVLDAIAKQLNLVH